MGQTRRNKGSINPDPSKPQAYPRGVINLSVKIDRGKDSDFDVSKDFETIHQKP